MIRKFIVFTSLMLALSARCGWSEEVGEKVDAEAARHQDQSTADEERISQPAVNTDFRPSEKIEADTVVAFPADI